MVLFVFARFWVMFPFSELRPNMYLGYQSTFTKSDREVSYRVNLQNIHDMLYALISTLTCAITMWYSLAANCCDQFNLICVHKQSL